MTIALLWLIEHLEEWLARRHRAATARAEARQIRKLREIDVRAKAERKKPERW